MTSVQQWSGPECKK